MVRLLMDKVRELKIREGSGSAELAIASSFGNTWDRLDTWAAIH
jgi:hypothetical protein